MTLRPFLILFALISITSCRRHQAAAPLWYSTQFLHDESGKFRIVSDDRGQRIPDFSNVGYKGGGLPLPHVDAVITLSPIAGDNYIQIQSALDKLGQMPLND